MDQEIEYWDISQGKTGVYKETKIKFLKNSNKDFILLQSGLEYSRFSVYIDRILTRKIKGKAGKKIYFKNHPKS